jgi:hypothetical protein
MIWYISKSFSQNVENCSFTTTSCTDKHESVTYNSCLVKLNNLNVPCFDIFEVELSLQESDLILNNFVALCWNVSLFWEDILNQRSEKRLILGDEF